MSGNDGARDEQGGVGLRLLRLFSEVRKGEAGTALMLMATLFSLLLSYYLVKTLREPLVLASAETDMQLLQGWALPEWLKSVLRLQRGPQLRAAAAACQALCLMGFVPLFAWLAGRVERFRLILLTSAFFFSCILLFWLSFYLGIPFVGFAFFVWVGIFSVAMVSLFWSFCNDLYSEEAGRRLFPLIGVGASLGSPTGAALADELFAKQSSPSVIVAVAGVALLLFVLAIMVVNARHQRQAQVQGERSRSSFALVLRSPYLRLIAVVILLLNTVNTTGEYIFSEYAVSAAKAAVARGEGTDVGNEIGRLYADYYFWVNILSLLLQAFVVSRLVRFTGLNGVVLALPLVALGGYLLAAVGAGFLLIRIAKTAENATDYSVMNTAKAMLWLPTSRAEKYNGKQTVDTFFVRFGDLLSAVLVIVSSTWLGIGVQGIAGANVALVLLWLGMSFLLLREVRRLVPSPAPATT
ncbi:MAG: translocase [Myxococcota bacterium]|jgi:AAA family ATP:ADP antiporter|nr:translocase [Myxococcota bacterium]